MVGLKRIVGHLTPSPIHLLMRPLRYSINVTLDGCCDHRAMVPDEDLHRHATEIIAQADALLFGRVTYEMMEEGWRPFVRTGVRPDWMEPWMESFAQTIDAANAKMSTNSWCSPGSPAMGRRCSRGCRSM